MSVTTSPVLMAAFYELVERLQADHGHSLLQDGSDDSGYFAILCVPGECFGPGETPDFEYMLAFSGTCVRVEVDAEGSPPANWSITDADLIGGIAAHVDMARATKHESDDEGDERSH